jgi:predicted methyltransferase
MKSFVLALSLALAIGCSKKEEQAPPKAAPKAALDAAAASKPPADPADPIRAAVAASDRSEEDRKLDGGRKPVEVLAFFKVAPDQKIGELFSGGGYTTELLARTVGDAGQVFAQNTTDILDRFARAPLTERLKKPVMKNTVMVERPLDDPMPPEARDLDAVIFILNYHDAVWMKADRAKMNAAIFAALKPGGVYGIVDHSAAEGSGVRDSETLHRIDEALVIEEVKAAGFKLDAESDILRSSADKRDWNSSPTAAGDRRGTSDRFVLRFVKP